MRTELMAEALGNLTERERLVMDGIAHGVRISQLAKEYHCDVGRIRTIKNRAVKKLRKSVRWAEVKETAEG